jgi:hypothetical protein
MSQVIDVQDQRKGSVPILHIDEDLIEAYCAIAGIDLTSGEVVKIRFRDGDGPYGYTAPCSGGYRVVINIRYQKVALSEAASYVVSNTLLHELRHVGQGQERGWAALSSSYEGWSEVEAREVGREIKGQSDMLAVR